MSCVVLYGCWLWHSRLAGVLGARMSSPPIGRGSAETDEATFSYWCEGVGSPTVMVEQGLFREPLPEFDPEDWSPTPEAGSLTSKFPRTLAKYGDAIQTVSDFVGAATVSELERLSTALYVIEEEDAKGDDAVSRITVLKPHVSREQAKTAIARIEELIQGSFSRLADPKPGE